MATPFLTSPLETAWLHLGATMMQSDGGWRLPASFAGADAEVKVARQAAVIGDESWRGKLLLQGDGIGQVLQQTFDAAPELVGRVVRTDSVETALLRPDLAHVGTTEASHMENLATLTTSCEATPVTMTDVTHGRFEIRVVGPEAPCLLSKVCGLDFDSGEFPADTAQLTSGAKTRQLILRVDMGDLPAFRLIGGRALGGYMWDTLMEAGREFGIEPIGANALQTLAG